jgi:NADH-quinone oxidoreductase subunit E
MSFKSAPMTRMDKAADKSGLFTPEIRAEIDKWVEKYPEGWQQSAVMWALRVVQEKHRGSLTTKLMDDVAAYLDMPPIAVYEVATFYSMYELKPVGRTKVCVCTNVSCMVCGSDTVVGHLEKRLGCKLGETSADGRYSLKEVECLGACANAPMAQIGKDYYEDLTAERFGEILDALKAGDVPVPGPQNGRYAAEPKNGLTSLGEYEAGKPDHNASAALAVALSDTVKRIDGTEVPLVTPWQDGAAGVKTAPPKSAPKAPKAAAAPEKKEKIRDDALSDVGVRPATLEVARDGKADNLKLIKGIGPKLEKLCNSLGFYHFDQIAAWTNDEVAWVDANLEGFKGRVTRDDWVAQAKILASGGETEFSSKAK